MMVRKFALGLCALVLAVGTAAWAQSEHLTGRVQHVDPASRVIYFHDGRIAHLSDSAVITVDGRSVTFDQVRPGMTVVVDTRQVSGRAPAVVAGTGSQVVVSDAWAAHPPIDASGMVARIDAQNGLITFQDGRVFRLTDRSRVWEPSRLSTVQPGDQVYVSGAQPSGYQSLAPAGQTRVLTAPATTTSSRQYMGTVVGVDQGRTQILLSDGRIVKVSPRTRMTMEDRTMTLAQLQPGDQLVITVADPAAAAVTPPGTVVVERDAASAFPRAGANVTLDAVDIKIMRRPQAP